MRRTIWQHLYNFKKVINIHGGVLKPATLLKVRLLLGCFSCFLKCLNGTKSRNTLLLFHNKVTSFRPFAKPKRRQNFISFVVRPTKGSLVSGN